ncbi:MAG: sigma-70 family RNA polymerase sigma factor [Clostridia bacterium]|nr:sigma-70 family RNA polymerase sigma factor [Clostridia bacterium]
MASVFDKLFENAECDKALISIANGDINKLEVIQRHMEHQIYAVAHSVLHDFSLADDVVQETYIKITEKAHLYTPGTRAKAWVLTMARNTALDMLRHRSFEQTDENVTDDITDRFDENSIVISMQVKKALDSLSDGDRQVVTLKVYAGLRHDEIAEIMGISTEAAKKKYQRAIKKMKEFF